MASPSARLPGFAGLVAIAFGTAVLFIALGFGSSRFDSAIAASGPCDGLRSLSLPNTRITGVEAIPAGTWTPPGDRLPSSTPKKIEPLENLPAFCRVMATVTPVADSEIEIEVWLPVEGWNGKLQSIGNHYFAGGIFYGDMAVQLRRGYATASTSMGHVGVGHLRWAHGHHEKVIDLAHRANHETAVLAKAVIAAHYGKAPAYAYFNGCSDGGREALTEAQKHPDDYNGIIAGGASSNYTGYNTQLLFIGNTLSGANNISTPQLKAVANAVFAQCDAQDGVKDNLLSNPSACHWKPRQLVCKKGQDPETCLTPGQASALQAVYEPIRDPVTKEVVIPGIAIGSEFDLFRFRLNQGHPHEAPLLLFALALGQPEFDARTFDIHRDVPKFEANLGALMNATNPDLSAFRARGGKLIEYKGWSDVISNPNWTAQYYDMVAKKFGMEEAQEFYRLFLMPSVGHCTGGHGPNTIGGLEQPTPPSLDAEHDLVSALEAWVEKGRAPQHIVATKYVDDTPAKGITMQRPICPYPSVAKYKGTGDTNKAENFTCAAK